MHPPEQSEVSLGSGPPQWPGYLPLLVLPLTATLLGRTLVPWAYTWLIAFAIYFSVKWLAWWSARSKPHTAGRSIAFLALWPGMDAEAFLDASRDPARPTLQEWTAASLKTGFGAALLWLAVPRISPEHLLFRGWAGMIGIVFLLHFGSFDLLARFWQAMGVRAEPIMQAPARSTSLSEFWGKRWNLGFRKLSHDFLFRPAQRRLGIGAATMLVFLVSGLIHELVISVPARAGYGLPTAYFSIQGIGVLTERSRLGRSLMSIPAAARLWTVIVAAAPAYWLFHPWFVQRVIVPFLAVIGAS